MGHAKAKVEAAPESVLADATKVAAAALRAFWNLCSLWRLSEKEQLVLLGLDGRATLYRWKKEPPAKLDRDKLDRIGQLLGIYKSLQILYPEPSSADHWIHKPNHAPFFGGARALDRMLQGSLMDLYEVRQYLNAQRGGWA